MDAERWANESLQIAREVGQESAAGDAGTTLALLRRQAGDPVAAAKQLEEAAVRAQLAGDSAAEVRSRFLLGSTHYEQGDLARRSRRSPCLAAGRGARPAVGGVRVRCAADAGADPVRLGDWDDAAATARIDSTTPAAAEAALRAVGLGVRGGRGDTAVAEELERLRNWWTLDAMLPIIGLHPAVDAYLR